MQRAAAPRAPRAGQGACGTVRQRGDGWGGWACNAAACPGLRGRTATNYGKACSTRATADLLCNGMCSPRRHRPEQRACQRCASGVVPVQRQCSALPPPSTTGRRAPDACSGAWCNATDVQRQAPPWTWVRVAQRLPFGGVQCDTTCNAPCRERVGMRFDLMRDQARPWPDVMRRRRPAYAQDCATLFHGRIQCNGSAGSGAAGQTGTGCSNGVQRRLPL